MGGLSDPKRIPRQSQHENCSNALVSLSSSRTIGLSSSRTIGMPRHCSNPQTVTRSTKKPYCIGAFGTCSCSSRLLQEYNTRLVQVENFRGFDFSPRFEGMAEMQIKLYLALKHQSMDGSGRVKTTVPLHCIAGRGLQQLNGCRQGPLFAQKRASEPSVDRPGADCWF